MGSDQQIEVALSGAEVANVYFGEIFDNKNCSGATPVMSGGSDEGSFDHTIHVTRSK